MRRAIRPAVVAAVALAVLILGGAYLASRPGSGVAKANGADRPERFAAIERFVSDEMGAQRIPGLALGIVEGDRVAYMRGFGDADEAGRGSHTADAVHHRVSEQVVYRARGDAARRGREAAARRAGTALPSWFRVADAKASREITVRHLLNQTSGLTTKTGRTFQGSGDTSVSRGRRQRRFTAFSFQPCGLAPSMRLFLHQLGTRRGARRPGRAARRAGAGTAEALLLSHRGELEQAEALARTAVATAETRTDTVWWQAFTHEDLATVLERAGRIDEAREALERSLAIWERKGCLPCAERVREQIQSLGRAQV